MYLICCFIGGCTSCTWTNVQKAKPDQPIDLKEGLEKGLAWLAGWPLAGWARRTARASIVSAEVNKSGSSACKSAETRWPHDTSSVTHPSHFLQGLEDKRRSHTKPGRPPSSDPRLRRRKRICRDGKGLFLYVFSLRQVLFLYVFSCFLTYMSKPSIRPLKRCHLTW